MKFVITRREALDVADGINRFIFSLSDMLVRNGHEVCLVTPSFSSIEAARQLFGSPAFSSVHYLCNSPQPSHSDMAVAWWKKGVPLLRSLQPDFAIVNGALPLRLPCPSCIVSHDLEKRWHYGGVVRRAYRTYSFRMADRIVATCSELRDALAKEISVRTDDVSVIPTCVDLREYRNSRLEVREPAILHLGTAEWKNPIATIEAFAHVRQVANLYVTGEVTPEIRNRLTTLPESVVKRISLLGTVDADRLKELLSKVRIISVPSLYSVPVASPTALEGLASGTPVVGSPSISADLLKDGHTGFRVDPRASQKLTETFDLLLQDDKLWQFISAASRERSEAFSANAVMQKYAELARS
jgi:glycosyltransferase involved in cell wall biosynthesis